MATRLGGTAAEKALWKAALAGEVADVSDLPERSRRVSPGFIRRLLTEEAARVAPRGVRLRGAWLDGPLDLARVGAMQPFAPALEMLACTGPGAGGLELDLREAALLSLDLSGSRLASLIGAGLHLAGTLRLDALRFGGGEAPDILLSNAIVEGPVSLSGPQTPALPEPAGTLSLEAARIGGDLHVANLALDRLMLANADLGATLRIGPGAAIGHVGAEPKTALMADGLRVRGDVFISGDKTRIEGTARLLGADIGGQLSVGGGAALVCPEGVALSADGASVKGDVFISGDKTRIEGTARLLGADIGGQLSIRGGAALVCPEGVALSADIATVKSSVLISGNKTRIEGETRLVSADIGGQLSIHGGAALIRPEGDALSADGASVKSGVFISGDKTCIKGETRLLGADIGGQLSIGGGAALLCPDGISLNAERATIKGGLFLRGHVTGGPGCAFRGILALAEARIGGGADLRGAEINEPPSRLRDQDALPAPGLAIAADGLHLDGDLLLGDPSTTPSRFSAARVTGAISLDRAHITGALVMTGARIEPGISAEGAEMALSLEGARIGARIECHGLPSETRGILDLRGAHTAFLDDKGGRGWGAPNRLDPTGPEGKLCGIQLQLDGFTFDRLPDFDGADASHGAAADRNTVVEARLAFLRRQFPGPKPTHRDYAPQPYEQAAKVLRAMGHPPEAEQIARAKRVFRTRCRVDPWHVRALQHFLSWGFGHFYSPLRAIRTLGIAVLLGLALLVIGDAIGAWVKKVNDVALPQAQIEALAPAARATAVPRVPREGCWIPPARYSPAYAGVVVVEAATTAFDLLIPLIDLKLDQRCEPDWDGGLVGRFFGVIRAIYSALGLVIFPLFVATVSGVAKRD